MVLRFQRMPNNHGIEIINPVHALHLAVNRIVFASSIIPPFGLIRREGFLYGPPIYLVMAEFPRRNHQALPQRFRFGPYNV